jgi:hypothetical protein
MQGARIKLAARQQNTNKQAHGTHIFRHTRTHTQAQMHSDSIKEGGEDERSRNATFRAASADKGKALPHNDNVSSKQADRQADR